MAIDEGIASVINSISPYALSEAHDRLLSLAEQRDLQNEVLLWTGDKALAHKPFVVSLTGEELGISRIADSPVILRHSDIDHIFRRHALDTGEGGDQEPMSMQELLDKLNRLPEELASNVLAFDDPEKQSHLCIVLGEKSRGGSELIAVANVEKEMSHASVVNIVTVHGRKNLFDRIERTAVAGNSIYLNRRTGSWIKSSQEKPGEITNCLLELYQASNGEINTISVNEALRLKAKAGDWASRAGVPFPERTINHLQSLLCRNGLTAYGKQGGWMEVQGSVAESAVTEKVIQRPQEELYQKAGTQTSNQGKVK